MQQTLDNFILHTLGHDPQTWPLTQGVYLVAMLLEAVAGVVHHVTGQILMVPLLTRHEVAKCAVTHYAKVGHTGSMPYIHTAASTPCMHDA